MSVWLPTGCAAAIDAVEPGVLPGEVTGEEEGRVRLLGGQRRQDRRDPGVARAAVEGQHRDLGARRHDLEVPAEVPRGRGARVRGRDHHVARPRRARGGRDPWRRSGGGGGRLRGHGRASVPRMPGRRRWPWVRAPTTWAPGPTRGVVPAWRAGAGPHAANPATRAAATDQVTMRPDITASSTILAPRTVPVSGLWRRDHPRRGVSRRRRARRAGRRQPRPGVAPGRPR